MYMYLYPVCYKESYLMNVMTKKVHFKHFHPRLEAASVFYGCNFN